MSCVCEFREFSMCQCVCKRGCPGGLTEVTIILGQAVFLIPGQEISVYRQQIHV